MKVSSKNRRKNQRKPAADIYTQISEMCAMEETSNATIAQTLSISKSTVAKYRGLWERRTPISEINESGRPRKIQPSDRTFLASHLSRNKQAHSRDMSATLLEKRGVTVSPRTVRRELQNLDYKTSVPRKIPLLTLAHKQKRIDWCREHLEFNWKLAIFSDETSVELFSNKIPVWHKSGCCPNIPAPKHPVKQMCWGAISLEKRTELTFVVDYLNSDKYIYLLQTNFIGWKHRNLTAKHVFQQDNAPAHNAKKTQQFFKQSKIKILNWPPNSPDLNPIENIWGILKHEVGKRMPKNREELHNVLTEEWKRIPQDTIRKCIMSMPNRIREVLDNDGEKCSY